MENDASRLFIGWAALSYAMMPGRVQYGGGVVHLTLEHIDRWQEDPEGVWEAKGNINGDQISYQLCRFQPSRPRTR
jgi:hypothetical protein